MNTIAIDSKMSTTHLPTQAELLQQWGGKDLADLPKPAVVLDRAIIRRHCERMKKTIQTLGVEFRAHVKTHKVSIVSPYNSKKKAHYQCKVRSGKLTPPRPLRSPNYSTIKKARTPNSLLQRFWR